MSTQSVGGRPATAQQLRSSIWCPRCESRWTGLGRQHCPACHRTFSSTSSGDAHRKGRGGDRHCVDPKEVGLIPVRFWWGECWTHVGLAGGQPYWQEPDVEPAPEEDVYG